MKALVFIPSPQLLKIKERERQSFLSRGGSHGELKFKNGLLRSVCSEHYLSGKCYNYYNRLNK